MLGELKSYYAERVVNIHVSRHVKMVRCQLQTKGDTEARNVLLHI